MSKQRPYLRFQLQEEKRNASFFLFRALPFIRMPFPFKFYITDKLLQLRKYNCSPKYERVKRQRAKRFDPWPPRAVSAASLSFLCRIDVSFFMNMLPLHVSSLRSWVLINFVEDSVAACALGRIEARVPRMLPSSYL